MLQLLNPIWLFGLSGILIPIVIHLWNVKTGKTLKVGSVSLLGESSRQNARSLKLMDLLLLLLRCLLIILLSLFLTEPVWKSKNLSANNKGWILAEKENFAETYNWFKAEIDSLITAGNEFHYLEPGFRKSNVQLVLEDTLLISSKKLSYWSLLNLLEQQIPVGSKAFIFTDNRLQRFKGERPSISTPISWKTYTSADSSSLWIEGAYLNSSGNIRATISESSPSGTLRKAVNIDPALSDPQFNVGVINGKPSVQFKDPNKQKSIVSADTATLKVAIFTDIFSNDTEYLTAALNAIQKYTLRKIRIQKFTSGQIPPGQDFLFCISSKNLADIQLKSMKAGSSIFVYASGQTKSVNSWIEPSDGQISLQDERPALYKRLSFNTSENSIPVWEDGHGIPILDMKIQNEISVYRFYSRLDPEWTELVWSPDFAKMLLSIIISEKISKNEGEFDRRSADHFQILPVDLKEVRYGKKIENTDLKNYLWILLMILFITERWLSFSKK